MSVNKKFRKSISFLALGLLLSSCGSSTPVKYPEDYSDKVFDNSALDGKEDSPVDGNDWKHYYDNVISSSSDVYKNALNQILLDISKYAYNNDGTAGGDVTHILNDFNDKNSVYLGTNTSTGDYDNLLNRAKNSMLSLAQGTDYIKDNLFYESKFVAAQQLAYTLGENFDDSKISKAGKFVPKNATYEQIFTGDYSHYMETTYYDDLRMQYLTADYIYNKSYASIGNSTARKVQVVALTDRSDNVGAAKRLLTAYVRDYIAGTGSDTSKVGTDPNFEILQTMWKGVTSDFVKEIDPDYVSRYPSSLFLTDDQQTWLKNDKLISDSSSEMLIGSTMSDKKKLDKMKLTGDPEHDQDAYANKDSSLESSYTDSYTHSVEIGLRNKIDTTLSANYVTTGIFTSSDDVGGVPTSLKNNIFSVNLATDKDTVDKMKNKKDKDGNDSADYVSIDGVSIFQNDGNRYIINNGSVSSDDNKIIHYDSDNKIYYIVRILDVVSNSALNQNSTTSMYDTASKKEQIAREVAFKLADSDTYQKEATIYYLRRSNLDISDDAFLTYLKDNYKDLFKTTSPYDSEPKIAFKSR